MRDPKTYRAFRRNEPGNFIRVDGANWKKPFEPKTGYFNPSKTERYLERRLRKLGVNTTEIDIVDDTAEAAEAKAEA